MSKRPITPTYTFTPASATLNLSGITNFDIRNLFAVINLKSGALLYAPLPGYGYTALSGTTLTLAVVTTTMSASDPLMIIYDDVVDSTLETMALQAVPATGDFQTKSLAQIGLMTEVTAASADEGAFSVRALLMRALKSLTSLIGGTRVFAPVPGATVAALANSTGTATPIKLPTQAAGTVDSYRVRLRANAAGPVFWTLSADSTKKPTATVTYDANGSNGTPGDKAIDPGGVEIIRLTDAQQAALAGAGLYLAVLAPTSDANTILSITPGLGGN